MSKDKRDKLIRILKVLLTLDDIEIIKCTLENIIDDFEEMDSLYKK